MPTQAEVSPERRTPEPLPANMPSAQPGGGKCYSLEMFWGRLRRWYLLTFKISYVERMAKFRKGSIAGAPHEILDPRDLKFASILCDAHWEEPDDPFVWRGELGFARWGLAELILMSTSLATLTLAFTIGSFLTEGAAQIACGLAATTFAVVLGLIVWFFRDPKRTVPAQPGLLVSPADGKITEVTDLDHDDFIGGPAVRIGIFLSIFNVHINRMPCAARVIKLKYSPGKFLNAMNPDSSLVNENLWIGLEESAPPHRPLIVRQVSGLIARRIVSTLRPGQELPRGFKFGMIKLGSRTELILPRVPGLNISTKIGQKVTAGETVLASWPTGAAQ